MFTTEAPPSAPSWRQEDCSALNGLNFLAQVILLSQPPKYLRLLLSAQVQWFVIPALERLQQQDR